MYHLFGVSIHLSYYISISTYFAAKSGDLNQCKLQCQSFTNTVTEHQYNVQTRLLLQDSNWNLCRWRWGLHNMINKSSKPMLEVRNITLRIFYGKTYKPLLSQNNLATLSYSLWRIHCSHFTYLTHLDTTYQSSQFVPHISLSSLLNISTKKDTAKDKIINISSLK